MIHKLKLKTVRLLANFFYNIETNRNESISLSTHRNHFMQIRVISLNWMLEKGGGGCRTPGVYGQFWGRAYSWFLSAARKFIACSYSGERNLLPFLHVIIAWGGVCILNIREMRSGFSLDTVVYIFVFLGVKYSRTKTNSIGN